MKKLLVLAALLAPASAFAGVGTTAHLTAATDGTSWVPSLDYRAKGILVQVHLLDTFGSMAAGGKFGLNTGVDVTYAALKKQVAAETEGVIMPGGSIRIADQGDIGFNVLAQMRMGAEMKKGMGFGIYVVPQLGISTLGGGDVHLAYGGGLQVSAWLTD